jgi:hypothetical protein
MGRKLYERDVHEFFGANKLVIGTLCNQELGLYKIYYLAKLIWGINIA